MLYKKMIFIVSILIVITGVIPFSVTLTESFGVSIDQVDTLTLGAGVHRTSPDGSRIEINGVIISHEGTVVGWFYDWGDGTRTTGYFSNFHKYQNPGTYTVTVTGYNDHGAQKEVTFKHNFPPKDTTKINRVELSNYSLGMKCGETTQIQVNAYDAQGEQIVLDETAIDVFNPMPQIVSTEVIGTSIQVSAKTFPDNGYRWAFIYVYVDNIEASKPLNIIINNNPGVFRALWGNYTGAYLPIAFFDTSNIPPEDFSNIIDMGFALDLWSMRGKWDRPPLFQGISYCPPIYGVSGNPLGLGDHALPKNGIPPIGVIFHEMGHNFHGQNIFFNCLGIPGPFYQETMAEWFAQFALNTLISNHTSELSQEAINAISNQIEDGRKFHESEYQRFIDNGRVFDYDHILSSQALVQKIFEYCDTYGWGKIRCFNDHYDLSYIPICAEIFSRHNGFTVKNKVTYLIATLSSTFRIDLKNEFEDLNFPINNELYQELIGLFTSPPNIDTISPNHGELGEVLQVTINGANLTGTTKIEFGEGISVENFRIIKPNQITSNIHINKTADSGNRTLTIGTPSGIHSLKNAFTIDIPEAGVIGILTFSCYVIINFLSNYSTKRN